MFKCEILFIVIVLSLAKTESLTINLRVQVNPDSKVTAELIPETRTLASVQPKVTPEVKLNVTNEVKLNVTDAKPPLLLVNGECLNLICNSTCFELPNCHKFKANIEHYGPFLLSKSYWEDAETPTLPYDNAKRDGAFLSCVCEYECAARTVSNYLKKHSTDCNNDKKVDCDDHKLIHSKGPEGCEKNTVRKRSL